MHTDPEEFITTTFEMGPLWDNEAIEELETWELDELDDILPLECA